MAYNPEKYRQRREKLKEAGLCTQCGKYPKNSISCLCERCYKLYRAAKETRHTPEYRAKTLKYNKDRRQQLNEHGLCSYCGQRMAEEGYVTCEQCRAEKRALQWQRTLYDRQKRQALLENGLCILCKKPNDKPEFKICESCRLKIRQRKMEKIQGRKERGICIRCGKNAALPGLKMCADCRTYVNQTQHGYFEHSHKWYEKERKAGRL